jgi:hypothetical protein
LTQDGPSLQATGTLTVTSTNAGIIVESPHPYLANMNYFSSNILLGGSGNIHYIIEFDTQTKTQTGYDFVRIRQGSSSGNVIYSKSGSEFPLYIQVESTSGITFELASDSSENDWGFKCTVLIFVAPTPVPTAQLSFAPKTEPRNWTSTALSSSYPTLASFVCDPFNVTGFKETFCNFTICPLSMVNVSCSYDNDTPSLALYNSSGLQVDDVSHYNSISPAVVGITYSKSAGPCQDYSLHQICSAGKHCSGTTSVTGASYLTPTANPSIIPTASPTVNPSVIPTASPTAAPSKGTVYLNVTVNSLLDGNVNESVCYPPTPSGSCNLRSAWSVCHSHADAASILICTITLPNRQLVSFNATLGSLSITHNFDSQIIVIGNEAVITDTSNYNGRFIYYARLAAGSIHGISLYNFTLSMFGGTTLDGGAIYMSGMSKALFSGMTFLRSKGRAGGSINVIRGIYSPSSVSIDQCKFTTSTSTSSGGAGDIINISLNSSYFTPSR